MGRKPRLEYPGGVYHIIHRGNNKRFIFMHDEEKELLINLIKEYQEKFRFQLLGYVIMSNHYHLIIKLGDVPLKDIMQRINNKFSRSFNVKYKGTGHVFENRFKGILVIDDRYLLSLLRYVHQNPVNAKICDKTRDYPWSSDKLYRTNTRSGIVNIDFILNIFSEDRIKALKAYIDFMDENKKEDIDVFESVDIIGKVNTTAIDEYIKVDKKSLDQILEEITEDKNIYNELKHGSRKRYLTKYKKDFIDAALKVGYTMKQIGESLSISDVAVYKLHNTEN